LKGLSSKVYLQPDKIKKGRVSKILLRLSYPEKWFGFELKTGRHAGQSEVLFPDLNSYLDVGQYIFRICSKR
jgi:hypothetical protein